MENRSLEGKTALVTGGGKGIGLGISQALLEAGAALLVVQRSAPPDRILDDDNVRWIKADLGDFNSYRQIAAAALKSFKNLDILVNNAGIMFEKPLETMSLDDWQAMITVNLTAPVFLTRQLLPLLRKKGGSVINIGSIEGLAANPQHLAYCASKGGIHALTKAMAVDFGKDNIRCNAIAPGWIKSDLSEDYITAQNNVDAARQGLVKMHPVGRIGKPRDVGKLAVYLAGDDSSFMSGQIIVLDGGRTSKLPLPF